ncbi:hypothetical protein SARC_10622 [Sphaeroforma arctica JP610]|uniref:Btz domain-containing protein n=1 Tax=Sphaeroforma arctica JP610 TaxID=667725 RepID=A0A0L0FK96_9EUKA|nr:hypothetical protein SARC_10622 [Sphaeroforma arctica JP610]KNC76901.1 hypothetical protein SARC_10622 [Sphaeroforma arctica JP610]|eukprot:XP_014150803.1 hypothetical protein SARC_10622 [Sphaeroforma arctica JP610]
MVEQEKQEDIDVDGPSIASVQLNDKFVHTQYNEYRNISNNNLAEADTQASMSEKENDDKIMTKDENIVVDNAMTGISKDIDEQMSKLEIKDTTGTTDMSTRSQRVDADGSIEGSTEAEQVADNESVISEEEEVVTDNSQSMDENDEVVDSEVESVEDSNSEYESESDYESGSGSGSNVEGDSDVDSESDVSDSVPRRRRRVRESLNESDVESEGEDGEAEVLSDSDQEQEQESEAESVYSDDSRSVKEPEKSRKTRAHKSKADPRGWYDEKNEGESEGGSVGDSDIEREDRTDEGKSGDAEDDEKKEGDEEEEEEAKPFDIPRAGKFYHHDDRSAGGGRGGGPGRRRRQLWDEDDAHRAEKWSHDMFEEHERTMPPRRNRMHEYNGSNHGRSRQTHGNGYDGKYKNGDREERHGNNQRESRNSRGRGGGGRGGNSSGNNRNNNATDTTNLDGDGEFPPLAEPKQAQCIIDALQDNVQPERTHTKRNNVESWHSVMVPANSTQRLTTFSGFGGSMVSDKGSGKKPLLVHAKEYIEDDEEPSGWKPQRYSEARPGLQDKIKNKNAKAGPLLPTKGATALPQQQPQTEEPQSNASAKIPQQQQTPQQQVQSPSSPLRSHEQDKQSAHEAPLTQPSVADKKLTQKQKKQQKNREKKERLREEKRLQKQLQEATNLPENWGDSVGIGMPPPQQNANDLGSQVNAKKAQRKEAQQQQRLKNQNQTSPQPDIDLQQQQTIQLLQLQLQLEQQQQQQQRRFQITQQGLVQQMAQQQQLLLSQQARAGDGNSAMASSNTSNSHNGGNGPPPIRSMLNANATEYGSGFNSNKFFTAGRFNDRPSPLPTNQYMPYSPADMNTMPWAQSNDLDLSAAQFMYAMQQSGMNNYLPPSSDNMNGFNPLSMAQYGSMGPYSAISGGSGGVGIASDLGPPSSDTFAPNSNNQNQFVPNFAMPFGNNSDTMNANSRTANDGSDGGQGGNTNVNAGAFVPGSSMHYPAMNTRRGQGQPRKVLTITPPPQ